MADSLLAKAAQISPHAVAIITEEFESKLGWDVITMKIVIHSIFTVSNFISTLEGPKIYVQILNDIK